MSTETVRRIGTLQHSAQLWISNARLLTRRAHATRTDADFNDIGTAENKLLDHLAGDHIARHDRVLVEHLAEDDQLISIQSSDLKPTAHVV